MEKYNLNFGFIIPSGEYFSAEYYLSHKRFTDEFIEYIKNNNSSVYKVYCKYKVFENDKTSKDFVTEVLGWIKVGNDYNTDDSISITIPRIGNTWNEETKRFVELIEAKFSRDKKYKINYVDYCADLYDYFESDIYSLPPSR